MLDTGRVRPFGSATFRWALLRQVAGMVLFQAECQVSGDTAVGLVKATQAESHQVQSRWNGRRHVEPNRTQSRAGFGLSF